MSKRVINLMASTVEELEAIATDAKNPRLSNEDREGVLRLIEEIHRRSVRVCGSEFPQKKGKNVKRQPACSCHTTATGAFPSGKYLVANFSQRDVLARVNYLRIHGDPDGAEELQSACDCGDIARVRLMLSKE